MVYITVSRDISLLDIINDLLKDLTVNNPEYAMAFDVGSNPVIQTISHEFNYNPMYFAEPTQRGVKFDLKKINAVKLDLENQIESAVQLANDIITFEIERLNATGITFIFEQKNYKFTFEGKIWKGTAEQVIPLTVNLPDGVGDEICWNAIKNSRVYS